MVDFSVLKSPNYLDIYQTSFANGQKMERDKRVQNVLKDSAADLVGAEKELTALGAFDEVHQLRSIRLDKARQKAAQALGAGDYKGAASAAAEAGDADNAAAYTQQGRNVDLGKQIAGGDLAGARTAGLNAGNFDAVAVVEKMDDRQKAQAAERTDTIAAIAQKLRADVPYPQRKQAIQSLAPALLQRGFSQEQIDGFLNADPSDANLDAAIASAMSLKEALAATKPDQVVIGDGGVVFDKTSQKPVFENRKNFAPPKASAPAKPPAGFILD